MMKKEIHPDYGATTISCGCGAVIETRSTGKDMHIEICSKCHPFYIGGDNKLIDTAGRIDKFRKRFKIQEGESSIKDRPASKKQRKVAKEEAEAQAEEN
jgi:large subunit ribosomal protein L31